jgi:hypothetical protein
MRRAVTNKKIRRPLRSTPVSTRYDPTVENTSIDIGAAPIDASTHLMDEPPVIMEGVIVDSSTITPIELPDNRYSPTSRDNQTDVPPPPSNLPDTLTSVDIRGVKIPVTPSPEVAILSNLDADDQMPDYDNMTAAAQAVSRAEFIIKFGILQKNWPSYQIPKDLEHLPLPTLYHQHKTFVEHIHAGSSADDYKNYLIFGWVALEILCVNFGLDISGFTVSQIKLMRKYRTLLIELGETKSSSTSTWQNWPVEVRLVATSLIQAVLFVVVKMLCNKTGLGDTNDIFGAISDSLFSSPASTPISTIAPVDLPASTAPNPLGGLNLSSIIGMVTNLMKTAPSAPTPVTPPTFGTPFRE